MNLRLIPLTVTVWFWSATATAQTGDVVATVNDQKITTTMLQAYKANRPQQRVPNDKALIQELVNIELLYQQAVKQRLDQREDVAATLQFQRRNLLAQAAVGEMLKANPVTEKELRKFYETQTATPQQEFKLAMISVSDEQRAKTILDKLAQGKDFAALAKKYSEDPSKDAGGGIGWHNPAKLPAPVASQLATLSTGSHTQTPAEMNGKWLIFKIEDKRDLPIPGFEQIKDQLRPIIENQRIAQYLAKLKKQAKVQLTQ